MPKKQGSEKLLLDIQNVIKQYPGLKMTVRQIYYRLVAAQKLANSMSSYNRVKRILTEARLEGKVRFDDIEDRTRAIITMSATADTVESYTEAWESTIRTLDKDYTLPRWFAQPNRVVVLVEKQALQGLFMDVCREKQVDLLVCRGYPSITVLYKLAQQLKYRQEKVQVLYFGDYDPSGLDIDRNVEERLRDNFGARFTFKRYAITLDQIEEYDIPPAPAKETDSRTRGMEERLGEAMQVELDAIDPPDLQRIIGESIDVFFDKSIYETKRKEAIKSRRKEIKEWLANLLADGNEGREDDDEDEDEEEEESEEKDDEDDEGNDDDQSKE